MLTALERRLTAQQLAVLAVVVLGYAGGSWLTARWLVAAGFDDASARLLAPAAAAHAHAPADVGELVEELGEIGLRPGERAALLAPDGRVRAWLGGAPRPARVDPAPGPRTEGALRALVVPLARAGRPDGALYLARGPGAEGDLLARFGLALLGMLPLTLLAAGLAGRWLARRAAAPVEAAIAREARFTRDVSHELRTPLAVLRLEAQLARAEAGLPPAVGVRLAAVEAAARRMATLVDDLLALARGEARAAGRPLAFSLAELVEEEVLRIRPLADARGVAIDLAPEAGAAPVTGDPAAIARIVQVLLDNAVRYAPAGGRIAVALAAEEGARVLTVAGPGAPIPPEERARIFERFGRGEAARAANPEGTGLGLAIARALAEAHGGTLALLPPAGAGNAFALRLPT